MVDWRGYFGRRATALADMWSDNPSRVIAAIFAEPADSAVALAALIGNQLDACFADGPMFRSALIERAIQTTGGEMLPDTITPAVAWQNLAQSLRARWHQRRFNAEHPFEAKPLDSTFIDEDLAILAHLGEIE